MEGAGVGFAGWDGPLAAGHLVLPGGDDVAAERGQVPGGVGEFEDAGEEELGEGRMGNGEWRVGSGEWWRSGVTIRHSLVTIRWKPPGAGLDVCLRQEDGELLDDIKIQVDSSHLLSNNIIKYKRG